jgi:phosphoglycolate phosphatase-like HAD superfamily hydrolase
MVGDTTWDVIAATAAGIPTLCVTTGGFAEQELRDAGAVDVVESLAEVRRRLRDGSDGFSQSR